MKIDSFRKQYSGMTNCVSLLELWTGRACNGPGLADTLIKTGRAGLNMKTGRAGKFRPVK
jgi:hypothetical protein